MSKLIEHKDKKWYAVRTKFRSEKFVIEQLRKQEIECYIPMLRKTRRYERKIKHYELPLISCYVFVCIDTSEYVKVLRTLYVYNFVRISGELTSIPNVEMNLMKRIVGEGLDAITEEISLFGVGDQVEIISGGMTGVKGELLEFKNKKEIVVRLDFVGKQIRMTMDKILIRKLSRLEIAI